MPPFGKNDVFHHSCPNRQKPLIQVAAGPRECVTLAARIRHDVVVFALRRIGVLEDRALARPDDVEDVGRYVALGHGALPILVEVKVIHGIDVDILRLTGAQNRSNRHSRPAVDFRQDPDTEYGTPSCRSDSAFCVILFLFRLKKQVTCSK